MPAESGVKVFLNEICGLGCGSEAANFESVFSLFGLLLGLALAAILLRGRRVNAALLAYMILLYPGLDLLWRFVG